MAHAKCKPTGNSKGSSMRDFIKRSKAVSLYVYDKHCDFVTLQKRKYVGTYHTDSELTKNVIGFIWKWFGIRA